MFLQVSVILSTEGGRAWLLPGGGGHVWLLWGGVHGCSGGHAWLLWGACMVARGGVHGCSRGGAWLLLGGACMVARGGMCGCSQGGHAWLLRGGWGGVRGFSMRYVQWAGGTHPTGMHTCYGWFPRFLQVGYMCHYCLLWHSPLGKACCYTSDRTNNRSVNPIIDH